MAVEIKNPELGTTTNTTPKVLVLNDVSGMPKAVDLFANTNPLYQHVNLDNTIVSSDILIGGSTITLTANKTNRYTGAQVNNFTVALGTPVANQINTYTMTFATGTSVPVVTWPTSPSAIQWAGGVPALEVSSKYSIRFTMLDSTVIIGEIIKFA